MNFRSIEVKRNLLTLIKERSFKKGKFQLRSGGESDYYIDMRKTCTAPKGPALIGEAIYDTLLNQEPFDALGGLEAGAIPLMIAAVQVFERKMCDKEGFWVRKEIKMHGMQTLIEGSLQPGMRVFILEDVITKGGSCFKAIKAVQDHGCKVVGVLGIVDRNEGADKFFNQIGIKNFTSIYRIENGELIIC
jgi:orotate phosphoribosyltransferase